jgi:hypothetical protein
MTLATLDTSGLDDLFGPSVFEDIDFDTVHSASNGKERIRFPSARYYEWVGMAKAVVAKVVAKVVAAPAAVADDMMTIVMPICPVCSGKRSLFTLLKGKPAETVCFRCMGKGKVNQHDLARHAAYLKRKASGATMDKSMNDYVLRA